MLHLAKAAGASQTEAEISLGVGQNVSVRMGETEILNITAIKALQLQCILGKKKGMPVPQI